MFGLIRKPQLIATLRANFGLSKFCTTSEPPRRLEKCKFYDLRLGDIPLHFVILNFSYKYCNTVRKSWSKSTITRYGNESSGYIFSRHSFQLQVMNLFSFSFYLPYIMPQQSIYLKFGFLESMMAIGHSVPIGIKSLCLNLICVKSQ